VDARKNRERLLRAARSVLAERGFDAEVSEIARRAKVGSGTFYRNFETKEMLILEIAREMVHKTGREMLSIAATVMDARKCVAETMKVGFRRVQEYGNLTIQLVAGDAPEPYKGVLNREGLANVFAVLIRRGISQGYFRPDLDVDYAVAVWFALVAPRAIAELLESHSIEEIATLTTDFYLAGISAKPDVPVSEPD
jgi:AcrR family transcriptional regulator